MGVGNLSAAVSTSGRSEGTTDQGRWPANVLHDGSDEVEATFAAFGERATSSGTFKRKATLGDTSGGWAMRSDADAGQGYGDSGTASRFFYSAKASAADRAGSKHPTVKPLALMRWLCRLICPPGGTILDPFAGSGTTGEAAMLEGFDAILIERETAADITHRVGRWSGADTPLFAEAAD
jgi:site-specific DNA-methyltransferase (adenine-specific)